MAVSLLGIACMLRQIGLLSRVFNPQFMQHTIVCGALHTNDRLLRMACELVTRTLHQIAAITRLAQI